MDKQWISVSRVSVGGSPAARTGPILSCRHRIVSAEHDKTARWFIVEPPLRGSPVSNRAAAARLAGEQPSRHCAARR